MKTHWIALPLIALTTVSSTAYAQDSTDSGEPPTGLPMTIAGGVFTAVGVIDLAGVAFCRTGLVAQDKQDSCLGTTLSVGAFSALIGIPVLLVGLQQRSHHGDWKRRSEVLAAVAHLDVSVGSSGPTVQWRTAF